MARFTVIVTDQTEREIAARGDKATSARNALDRYFYLLKIARQGINGRFSEGELGLLCDVCNGTHWEANTLCMIRAEIEDSDDTYFEKWGVSKDDLLCEMERLTLLEEAALVDAIERYWQACGTGMEVRPGSILR